MIYGKSWHTMVFDDMQEYWWDAWIRSIHARKDA